MVNWIKSPPHRVIETFTAHLGIIRLEVQFDPPNDEWLVYVNGYTNFYPVDMRYKSLIDAQKKAESYATKLLNDALDQLMTY